MGRTRTFDVDEAIGAATKLFWRGYDNTSMAELTEGLGIGAASFYHTFESKEALFREVVRRYIEALDAAYREAFSSQDSLEATRSLLRHYAEVVTNDEHTAGCLVVNSSPSVGGDEAIKQWLASHRDPLRVRLQQRFAEDVKNGMLSGDTNPKTMARLVLALAAGIAVEARAGASRRELYAVIELALQPFIRHAAQN